MYLKEIIWAFVISLILIYGIYYTHLLNYPQYNLKKMINKIKTNKSNLTSLFISLGGKMGVGSIAGVALAIYLGGPGTVFWIWVITFISASIVYKESYLAANNNRGLYAYMGEKVLKIYGIILIFTYLIGVIPIQANTIKTVLNINPLISVTILLIFFLLKCEKKDYLAKMVPIMAAIYLFFILLILALNIQRIPNVLIEIIKSATNVKDFTTSFLPALLIGIERGQFATESGMGTSAIATSYSTCDRESAAYIQVFGTYFTTFLICTPTALVVLLSGFSIKNNINGIEIIKKIFMNQYGNFGNFILITVIILFAFSTILSAYYYLKKSFTFLFKNTKYGKILIILSILIGNIIKPLKIWYLIDIFVGLMIILNVTSIIKYKK